MSFWLEPPARPTFIRRIVQVISVLGIISSALQLATAWGLYSRSGLAAMAFAATAAAALMPVVIPRLRHDKLPLGWAVTATAILVAVDLLLPRLLPVEQAYTSATWNWGAAGTVFIVMAAYRPLRDITVGVILHGVIGVMSTLSVGPAGGPDPVVTLSVVLNALPALAASYFLRLYGSAVSSRDSAVATMRAEQTRADVEAAVRADHDQRLTRIRKDVEPILLSVGNGAPLPLDPHTASRARELADGLRRELIRTADHGWLPAWLGNDGQSTTQIDVHGRAGALNDAARVDVAALIGLLSRAGDLRRVTVRVIEHGGAGAGAQNLPGLIVVAEGPAAPAALADPAVRSLAEGMGASLWHDGAERLVIDAPRLVSDGAIR